jgi:hypothetical protein
MLKLGAVDRELDALLSQGVTWNGRIASDHRIKMG